MIKIFSKISLVFLGLILFIGFIWIRFIRERLPKILPFINLNGFGLIILVYICSIYLLIIYFYLKKHHEEKIFITNVVKMLYLPLTTFDNYIKSFSFIKEINYKFLLFLARKNFWYYCHGLFFFYIFEIFPRIILVTVFVIDTYYFHYLSNIYKVLFIGLLIIIGKYIKFSFKTVVEQLIIEKTELISIGMLYEYGINIVNDTPPEDLDEENFIPDYLPIPLEKFIRYQTELKIEGKEIFPYTASTTYVCFEILRKKYGNLSSKIRKNIIIENKIFIKELLEISYISEWLHLKAQNSIIKTFKILIFLNYFLLWLYIIIISLPFVNIDYTFLLQILENLRIHLENENFWYEEEITIIEKKYKEEVIITENDT